MRRGGCVAGRVLASPSLAHDLTPEAAERLKELLHRSPRDFGRTRSTWTLELAAQVSFEQGIIDREVSDESVRRALK